MSEHPPGGYPPPQPPQGGGYPPPQQPPQGGGFPPPRPPQGGGYPPPQQPPPGGGYPPPQPPPGAGYPPPQQPQGFPPPQQGGYPPQPGGFPPSGPPGYGYGGYGAPQKFNVGEGFSWAWNKFSKNAAALIVPALVFLVIIGVLYAIVYGLATALAPEVYTSYGDTSFSYSAGFGAASYIVLFFGYIVLFVVGSIMQSAYISGLLEVANGRQVAIGDFFKPRNVGNVIIAGLIIGVATAIGNFLCFLPGLIIGYLLMFTIVALLDRNLAPVDALKASFELTTKNLSDSIIAYLVMVAIAFAGALACGIGLIVAAPVAGLFLVYTYRRLSGAQVAP